jgi:DNA-nicking Smr family endonuclease
MARAKRFSEDDLRLWEAYSKTLKLLPGKTPIAAPPDPPPPPPAPIEPHRPAQRIPRGTQPLAVGPIVGMAPPGLDRASWRKFRVGQIPVARSLDLHGHTAAHAHRATIAFLQQAHAQQQRCVEIITGKGDILARELPLWLEAPPLRALVLALAYPHAANTGAVRVLLRRLRK